MLLQYFLHLLIVSRLTDRNPYHYWERVKSNDYLNGEICKDLHELQSDGIKTRKYERYRIKSKLSRSISEECQFFIFIVNVFITVMIHNSSLLTNSHEWGRGRGVEGGRDPYLHPLTPPT